jgi:hypothetical protein
VTLRIRLVVLAMVIPAAAGLVACTGDRKAPTNLEHPAVPGSSATSQPSGTPATASAPSTIDGTAFYFQSAGNAVQVWSSRNGVVAKHYRISVAEYDACVANSVIVSPDGRWLAWVASNGDPSGIVGTLSVSGLDGRNPRTLKNVICSFNEFSWTPDSGRLAITRVVGGGWQPLYFDVRTGATEARTDTNLVWSANRAFRVRLDANHPRNFIVETMDGTVVRPVKDYKNDFPGFDTCGYTVKGVSDDGRYVTIGWCATDPSRVMGAHYLFDTVTGQHVKLPVKQADAIIFLGGGTVLVRGAVGGSATRSLVLMSTTGQVITETVEPRSLPTNATFLCYLPLPVVVG